MTTNYDLHEPLEASKGWHVLANQNLDTISSEIQDTREKVRAAAVLLAAQDTTLYLPQGFNMGFDNWQRGAGAFTSDGYGPDLWYINVIAGTPSTARATGTMNSQYQVNVTLGSVSDEVSIANEVPYPAAYSNFHKFCRGKVITFAIDLKIDTDETNGEYVVKIDDGGGSPSSTTDVLGATGTVERIVETHTVSASSTKLEVSVKFKSLGGSSKIFSMGNASVAIGTFATLPYVPINPQDDLFGCYAMYQKMSFDLGWYGRSTAVDLKWQLVYPCPMLATPGATLAAGSAQGSLTTSTFEFVPVNQLCGYIHAVVTGGSGDVGYDGSTLELEVT